MNIQDYFDWDEYKCTGVDPTGGCLGPDFDPETGKYLYEIEEEEAAAAAVAQKENVLAKAPYNTDSEDLHRMSKLAKSSPQYLFFDTETTGLPYFDNISAETSPANWPRLVQLSWIMTDGEGNITKEMNKFVIPEGFTIPAYATEIHGISTEYASYWGEKLERVLHVFNKSFRKADSIICHNTWFDINVIYGEMKRMNIPTNILEKKSYCTMLTGQVQITLELERRITPRTGRATGMDMTKVMTTGFREWDTDTSVIATESHTNIGRVMPAAIEMVSVRAGKIMMHLEMMSINYIS